MRRTLLRAGGYPAGSAVLPGRTRVDIFEVAHPFDDVCHYSGMPHEEAGLVGRLVVGRVAGEIL